MFLKNFWIVVALFAISMSTACDNKNAGNKKSGAATVNNWPGHFGFGQPASAEHIAAMDIDVRPDGKGLPEGTGNVRDGQKIYVVKCAQCHGKNGMEGPFGKLVASDTSKEKTIGNYWPYATTIFDYVRRAMPLNAPGSLSNEEVYDVTAFLLFRNRLIDSNAVINAETLPTIEMPAKKLFINDDRKGGNEIR